MAATILSVQDLEKSFGVELIFSGVTFQIQEKDRVALVGANGAGKSTLLKIVAGLESNDSGSIVLLGGLRTAYQAQEARFLETDTVWEAAMRAFEETRKAEAELKSLEHRMGEESGDELDRLFERYSELSAHFETGGGYEMEHRTEQVLAGLGFDEEDYSIPVSRLSGGQKTRLALAHALLEDPDLLMLDEPTNHLDLDALEWLENFLRSWSRTFIVISHDRFFLDRVTNRTMDLSFGTLEDYPAGYSRYLVLKEERISRRIAEYEAQQEFILRTEEYIRRYKAGQRSREARGRATRLARMERLERPQEQQALRLRMGSTVRSGRMVLHSTPLDVGYPPSHVSPEPTHLFSTPELLIERGDRVALMGPNGTGKTSLLRTIMGEIKPLRGRIEFGVNVKPAYYAQGHEGLDLNETAISTILKAQAMSEEGARSLLGRFLFSGDDAFKSVSALSGGERSRLALAKLTLEHANLLILDEPTNHLDISSREALEEVLEDYDGTILFVSHDRYLVDRLANRVWFVDERALQQFLGNYSDYLRARDKAKAATFETTSPASVAEPRNGRSDRSRPSDQERRQTQQELTGAERTISRLEAKMNELSDELARATIDQDVGRIAKLGERYEQIQHELEQAYARWEELGNMLSTMMEAIQQ
ncbi:MAG: ABC-F family ATP-binding cassette domain-containing protein [Nitrolancea sp.]